MSELINEISYSFFTTRREEKDVSRFYDKYISSERYWYNIPDIALKENPLYKVIEDSINRIGGISVEVMNYDYKYNNQ